jgi:hypothetical protein
LPAGVINLIMMTKLQRKASSPWQYTYINDSYDTESILYYTLARLLMIINHSINFLLYFVLGKRFRRDLKRLVCLYWKRIC